jgi:hypothetical protein
MAVFGDRNNWILLWSSQAKFLKYFFSYARLKIYRFLLNNNRRCESENEEDTSSTNGKSVKERKNRKYDSYLGFGFTSTEVDGERRLL